MTACHPAALSACIWAANSSAGTYKPGNGAPAGGGLITWYMRIGTVALPGTPVPLACVRPAGEEVAAGVERWCEEVRLTAALRDPVRAAGGAELPVEPPPAEAIATTAAIATTVTSDPVATSRLRRARLRLRRCRSSWRAFKSLKLIGPRR